MAEKVWGPRSFTYKPLEVEDVRWYWLKPPFSWKAVAQTDIPHRGQLQRFCSADSQALEEAYRDKQEELDRAWWQEQAELSTGPAATPSSPSKTSSPSKVDTDETMPTWQDFIKQHEGDDLRAGVLVRGGLQEVDLMERRMRWCYWPDTQHRVLRGTWFIEKGQDMWSPLKETLADELENAYRSELWNPGSRHSQQQHQGIRAGRLSFTSLSNKGSYALFASPTEIYLCKDDTMSWLSRKWSQSTPPGTRLRRGYVEPQQKSNLPEVDTKAEEADDFCATTAVTRLVLVVHGVGQMLSAANIVEDTHSLRTIVRKMMMDQVSDGDELSGRTELLPVQWRKHLSLDVDKTAETVMVSGIRPLRSMLHSTAVEVLLYLTPLHCQDMLDSLVLSLNTVYAAFMLRHPGFDGTVSLVGHSLGSVLGYDILCNQPNAASPSMATAPSYALSSLESDDALLAPLRRLAIQQVSPASSQALPPAHTASTQLAPLSSADLASMESVACENAALVAAMDQAGMTSREVPALDDATGTAHHSPAVRASSAAHAPGASQQQAAIAAASPPSAAAPDDPRRLQQEVAALRAERDALLSRLHSLSTSAGVAPASTSGAASPAGGNSAALAGAQARETQARLQPTVDIKPLGFAVHTFIAIGSPLGLFLALRGVDPAEGAGLGTAAAAARMPGGAHSPDGLPAIARLYNLYQPYDPVAYRVEPLVWAGAEQQRPMFVPWHKGGRRIHIGLQEFSEDIGAAAGRFGSNLAGSFGLFKMVSGKAASAMSFQKTAEAAEGDAKQEDSPPEPPQEDGPSGSQVETKAWRLSNGPAPSDSKGAAGRLDFVLQDSPTENAYLSAISSHFSYWGNADTALFILRAVNGIDVITGPVKEPKQVAAEGPPGSSPRAVSPGMAGASPSGGSGLAESPESIVDASWHTGMAGSAKKRQLMPSASH